MPYQILSSFYNLRAKTAAGHLMTRDQLRAEVRAALWIWDRWAKNLARRLHIRIGARPTGKTWSGAYFPSERTAYLSTDWIWPWTSVRRVLAHEIGHALGLWNNGQHPSANGRFSHIMSTGASGWYGQLHPSEARWATTLAGRGTHNYHPLVRDYHRDATAARRKYGTLGTRLREARKIARELRRKNQQDGLNRNELVKLNTANRQIVNFTKARHELNETWAGWNKTIDPIALRVGLGYGSLHRKMLPEQINKTSQATSFAIDNAVTYLPYGMVDEPTDVICCGFDSVSLGLE